VARSAGPARRRVRRVAGRAALGRGRRGVAERGSRGSVGRPARRRVRRVAGRVALGRGRRGAAERGSHGRTWARQGIGRGAGAAWRLGSRRGGLGLCCRESGEREEGEREEGERERKHSRERW
jgi:hypothetical protein